MCSSKAQEKLQECIKLEREEPVTSNEHYLADYKIKFMARYKAERNRHVRNNSNLQKLVDGAFNHTRYMQEALDNLKAMGLQDINPNSLVRLIPPDNTDAIIEIMAEVRAYYQGKCQLLSVVLVFQPKAVAFKRFVDNIPMIMDFHLLKGFAGTVEDALFKDLSLGESEVQERCTEYLKEDPTVERKRQTLKQDLEKFESAFADLLNIPGLSLFADSSDSDSQVAADDDLP